MIVLLVYLLTWVGWFVHQKTHPLRLDFTVTIVWLLSVLLNFVPALVEQSTISVVATILIVCSHLAFIFGFHLGGGAYSIRSTRQPSKRSASGVKLLLWMTVAFVTLTALSAALTGSVPILGAVEHLQSARQEYLRGTTRLSLLDTLSQALKYPAIVFVCMLPLFAQQGKRLYVATATLAALSIVEGSLRVGGRGDIVWVLIALASAWILVYRVNLTRGFALGFLLVVVAFYLGSAFVLARNTAFDRSPTYFTRRVCAVEHPGRWLSDEASPQTRVLALSTCYFLSPVHNLDHFIADNEGTWSYRFGAYNLGLLFRPSLIESRTEIARYYQSRGLATNPWATSVRDFWLDFGPLAPFGFLPVGFLLARASPRSLRNDEFAVARVALLLPAAVMLPFISPLVIPSIVYPIVIVSLIGFATRIGMFHRQRPPTIPTGLPALAVRSAP